MTSRFAAFLLFAALLCSCGPARENRVIIGSKNFTEQLILGELMAQQLESHTSLHVERRFYLAGTFICQQALLAGRIDVYREYTGTALTAILKEKPTGNRQDVYSRANAEYEERCRVEIAPPPACNETCGCGT